MGRANRTKSNLLNAVLLLFLILGGHVCRSQVASPSTQPGCKAGNLSEESAESIAKVSAFLSELQNAVRSDDRSRVSTMISYPLLVSKDNSRRRIRSEKEFLDEYTRIFTPQLKVLSLKQSPQCVSRVGAQGFTISRGEIWFDIYPSGEVKIFTITPVVMPDE